MKHRSRLVHRSVSTWSSLLLVALSSGVACTSHRIGIDPIEIKPIQVTVDVNVQVQRKLDDFFDFEEVASEESPRDESGEKR
ncbi:MAG TPA: hypothetical protein PKE00_00255 [Planctomycetota bacterium]|nr:hypothetical protein [Planctomycetota bacterium]